MVPRWPSQRSALSRHLGAVDDVCDVAFGDVTIPGTRRVDTVLDPFEGVTEVGVPEIERHGTRVGAGLADEHQPVGLRIEGGVDLLADLHRGRDKGEL
jgi:hypothetical protein